MLSLLAGSPDAIGIIFGVIGFIMFVAVVIGLTKIIRNPSSKSDGKTSWDRKAEELAQTMSADELYALAQSHIDKTIPDADFVLGKAIMRKAAEKGSARAQFYIGKDYDYSDNALAVDWFKKAAEQGLDEACERLGDIYNYGREDYGENPVSPDYEEAAKWYLPLAEKGNVEIMKTLALMYSLDMNDEENSLKWYIKAAETGDLEAIKEVVTHYDIEEDSQNAILWCKKAAETGDAESMFDLARLYEFADEPDMEQAVFWYKKAAENGESDANVKLALFYIEGDGVEKDEKKGLEMLQAEAANGNDWAKCKLGIFYKEGKILAKDVKKAFGLFTASKQYFASRYQLALLYLEGDGVEKNQQTAFGLLSEDLENCFDEETLFKLGECYFYGWGTEKDKEKARELWRKAAEYDSKDAIEALDRLFGEQFVPED